MLTQAVLQTLAEIDDGSGVSLPRLAKRLDLSGSVLLRRLHLLSDASIGRQAGPGWVRVAQDGERWMAWITEAGRSQSAALVRAAQAEAESQAMQDADPTTDDQGQPLPPALVRRPVLRHAGSHGPQPAWQDDDVAAEVPVALVFNGLSHAVMMCTPSHLREFALGFALSEGLIDTLADCHGIELRAAGEDAVKAGMPTACEVHLDIASRCFVRLKEKRRALAGRTGCGICGIDSLQALDIVPEHVTPRDWATQLAAEVVLRAIDAMPALQVLNAASGAIHAAGWARPDGTLTDLTEDVGRHNALDKLIGRLAAQERLGEEGFVVMSSRASYELVRKCARLDIPLLATVSAPTSLAIDLAGGAGLALWGLCRPPRAIRYT